MGMIGDESCESDFRESNDSSVSPTVTTQIEHFQDLMKFPCLSIRLVIQVLRCPFERFLIVCL